MPDIPHLNKFLYCPGLNVRRLAFELVSILAWFKYGIFYMF